MARIKKKRQEKDTESNTEKRGSYLGGCSRRAQLREVVDEEVDLGEAGLDGLLDHLRQ